jgi:hypothetical protein
MPFYCRARTACDSLGDYSFALPYNFPFSSAAITYTSYAYCSSGHAYTRTSNTKPVSIADELLASGILAFPGF